LQILEKTLLVVLKEASKGLVPSPVAAPIELVEEKPQ